MHKWSVSAFPLPACRIDAEDVITEANSKISSLLSYPGPEYLYGFPVSRLIAPTDRECLNKLIPGETREVLLLDANGDGIRVRMGIWYPDEEMAGERGGEAVYMCTSLLEKESSVPPDSRFIDEFAKRLISAEGSATMLSSALDAIFVVFRIEAAGVYLYNEKTREYRLSVHRGVPEKLYTDYSSIPASSFETEKAAPMYFSDKPRMDPVSPVVRANGFSSYAILPLSSDGEVFALLVLFGNGMGLEQTELRKGLESTAERLSHLVARVYSRTRLEESEELYRSLVRSMPSGVLVRNRDGIITHFNTTAERIFSISREEALGRKYDFKGGEFYSAGGEKLKERDFPSTETMRTGVPVRNRELMMKKEDGANLWLSVNAEPLMLPGTGELYGTVVTFKDVSENKKILGELERAKRLAEEASRSKSQFLANISHEIRTPLSGIMGMTDILLTGEVTEQQRENLLLMKDAEDSLLDIINKVLEISKIESGKIGMEIKPFRLRSIVNRAAVPVFTGAREKQLGLDIRIHPEVPELLIGDASRLQQVLTNLLSNALKFTEEGGIQVFVRPYGSSEDEETHLLFSVEDTGVGIPEGDRLHIFENFSQVDASYSKKQQGTGLGLAISKELVELMGGSIWVESRRNGGSIFFFTLSFSNAGVEKEAEENEPEADGGKELLPGKERAEGKTLSILLAEDNLLNQKSISHLLELRGYRVKVVENGSHVLEELEKNYYDIVLMDVQMPVMDGVEATKRVRESSSPNIDSTIPIIALTAYAMKEEELHFLTAGMDGYLTKPLFAGELYQTIETSLLGYSSTALDEVAETSLDQNHEEGANGRGIGLSHFMKDYQNDMEIGRQLLELFIQDVPNRIRGVMEALNRGDASSLRENLHSLTNNLSALRLYKLGASIVEMEKAVKTGDYASVSARFPSIRPDLHASVEEAQKYLDILYEQG